MKINKCIKFSVGDLVVWVLVLQLAVFPVSNARAESSLSVKKEMMLESLDLQIQQVDQVLNHAKSEVKSAQYTNSMSKQSKRWLNRFKKILPAAYQQIEYTVNSMSDSEIKLVIEAGGSQLQVGSTVERGDREILALRMKQDYAKSIEASAAAIGRAGGLVPFLMKAKVKLSELKASQYVGANAEVECTLYKLVPSHLIGDGFRGLIPT